MAGLALSSSAQEQANTLSIDYDAYTLDNGLQVILHHRPRLGRQSSGWRITEAAGCFSDSALGDRWPAL